MATVAPTQSGSVWPPTMLMPRVQSRPRQGLAGVGLRGRLCPGEDGPRTRIGPCWFAGGQTLGKTVPTALWQDQTPEFIPNTLATQTQLVPWFGWFKSVRNRHRSFGPAITQKEVAKRVKAFLGYCGMMTPPLKVFLQSLSYQAGCSPGFWAIMNHIGLIISDWRWCNRSLKNVSDEHKIWTLKESRVVQDTELELDLAETWRPLLHWRMSIICVLQGTKLTRALSFSFCVYDYVKFWTILNGVVVDLFVLCQCTPVRYRGCFLILSSKTPRRATTFTSTIFGAPSIVEMFIRLSFECETPVGCERSIQRFACSCLRPCCFWSPQNEALSLVSSVPWPISGA